MVKLTGTLPQGIVKIKIKIKISYFLDIIFFETNKYDRFHHLYFKDKHLDRSQLYSVLCSV